MARIFHKVTPRPSTDIMTFTSNASGERNGHIEMNRKSDEELAGQEIEDEYLIQVENSRLRYNTFESLFCGSDTGKDVSIKYGLYCGLDFLLTLLSTSLVVIIPMHNLILHPEYWYEMGFQFVIGILPIGLGRTIYEFSALMNIDYILGIRHYRTIYLACAVTCIASMVGLYVIWVLLLGNRYPMPFHVMLYALPMKAVELVVLWFRFPRNWRCNPDFRKRMKWLYVAAFVGNMIGNASYSLLDFMFVKIPPSYQWILAIVLPFFNEFNVWTMQKLAGKASFGDLTRKDIVCTYNVNLRHTMFLTLKVSNGTTTTLIYILLASFFQNLYVAIKIIYLEKQHNQNKTTQIEMLQSLVLNELSTFMVPLVYLMVLMLAYFGPNHHLIGNVGNDYFGKSTVSDIKTTIVQLITFFCCDTCAVIIRASLLYFSIRINLPKAFLHIRKEFGLSFSVFIVFQMNQVSN